jgi:hypothetical protein
MLTVPSVSGALQVQVSAIGPATLPVAISGLRSAQLSCNVVP